MEHRKIHRYFTPIDLAVKSGMMVIDDLLSPEFQGISDMTLHHEFDEFLRATSCIAQDPKLRGTIIEDALSDLYKLYQAKCHRGGRLDSSCLMEYMRQVRILKDHLSSQGGNGTFVVMHQQMAQRDTSGGKVARWTLVGFWQSFLQRALLQQFEDWMSQWRSEMDEERNKKLLDNYLGPHGMRRMLDTIWDGLQGEGGAELLPLSIKLPCEQMADTYAYLEPLLIEANIEQIVNFWINGKNRGSIGVVIQHPPSEGLIHRFKDMGFDENDVSVIHVVEGMMWI